MLKYILLLCLILQLGACKKLHVRERSQEPVETVVETNDQIKDDTIKKIETNHVKTLVDVDDTGHVVKKDHVETSNVKDLVVEPIVQSDVIPKPENVNKTEEEEEVKVDVEESVQEKGSTKNSVGSSKQSILNLGLGDICRVNGQVGTCVASSLQCLGSRGTVLGSLGASGQCPALAVCCQVVKTCGQTSSKKSVIFGNPTNFQTATTTCDFTVNVVDPKVCQIRLDFETFVIASARQPNGGNTPFTCLDDSFTVISPSNEKIPTICGYNTDQNMYIRVNFTNNERSIRLRFSLAGRPSTTNGVTLTNPQWKIRVTQLECPSIGKNFLGRSLFPFRDPTPLAPPGCLQYFPARTGTIRNFGYNPNSALAANNYIANMDYSICFRRTTSTCGIRLSPGSFMMSGNENACTQGDFLTVPEGVITRADKSTAIAGNARVCANMLPMSTSISSTGNFPSYVHFVTDNVNGNNENGFNLMYEVISNNCM